jgi:mannose-6-phosphate isomerase-like protein (cupin superfamily)
MAKLSRDDATARVERMPGYEGRYREADGYTMAFEKFEEGGDFTPFYKGLPDGLCQSHHWGFVIRGRLIMHTPAGDEIVEAGEAYYTPPGHTDELAPGTELIEFSPSDELARTLEVVGRNLESQTT